MELNFSSILLSNHSLGKLQEINDQEKTIRSFDSITSLLILMHDNLCYAMVA